MIFSKSFGYAVRGVLFIALEQDKRKFIQAEEIASRLEVPRHFMGKVLKSLAKHQVLSSVKGPFGGFTLSVKSLDTSLIDIVKITDGLVLFKSCVLRFQECNALHPCPLHYEMAGVREDIKIILSDTTFRSLLHSGEPRFLEGITNGIVKPKLNNTRTDKV